MQFALEKFRTVNIEMGKISLGHFELRYGQFIKTMHRDGVYKYLGIKRTIRMAHGVKNELTEAFRRRLLTKPKLNSKYLFKVINSYA